MGTRFLSPSRCCEIEAELSQTLIIQSVRNNAPSIAAAIPRDSISASHIKSIPGSRAAKEKIGGVPTAKR
jgi:hypothetical protein